MYIELFYTKHINVKCILQVFISGKQLVEIIVNTVLIIFKL